MATDLYIISNIKLNRKEILEKKDWYIEQLNALRLECTISTSIIKPKSKMNYNFWEYDFPIIYNPDNDEEIIDIESPVIIEFDSPTVFGIRVYENCLELTTIYRYRFIYHEGGFISDYFWEFTKNIYDIISIFGGTEIIYLADNGCNILTDYLGKVWEGVSYEEVKKDILSKKIPLVSDYYQLNYDELDYRNIKEIVFYDFNDLKNKD